MNKKALIAMSGGVDSSVAAFLTKEKGFECMGVTMKLFHNDEVDIRENTCCSLEDVEDARSVAYRLGMPYYVFNFSDRFKEDVIDKFVEAYENGRTSTATAISNLTSFSQELRSWGMIMS